MLSAIISNIFTSQKYCVFTRFKGTLGPINCLSFTRDGKLLGSGADDQALRIWDVQEKRLLQTLEDKSGGWGQITCMKWLSVASAEGYILCFGTGRGLIVIYQGAKNPGAFREMTSTNVFPLDDPVESVDFDRSKCRLAITSHNGKIRMYSIDKNGILISIWEKSMPTPGIGGRFTTPRSIRFTGKGEYLLVFGLESGIMESKISATGAESWSKILGSSIGNACLSYGENLLLVDNLVHGFDLYKYPHTSPFRSLDIPREKCYVLGNAFVENGISVACGSDHGSVYLFSIEKGTSIQELRHGSRHSVIQAMDAVSTIDCHLMASGSNDDRPDIVIWVKSIKTSETNRNACKFPCNIMTILMVCNFLIVTVLALAVGLNPEQREAVMAGYRDLHPSRHRYVSTPYDYALKEQARVAMERSKEILIKMGIDIDDPEQMKLYKTVV